ncbi:MAG: hypothetical protein ACXV3D_00170 [Halobacteriota archaeon]
MAQEDIGSEWHKHRTLRVNVKSISPFRKTVARTKEALIDVGTFGLMIIFALGMEIYGLRMQQDNELELLDVYGDLGY